MIGFEPLWTRGDRRVAPAYPPYRGTDLDRKLPQVAATCRQVAFASCRKLPQVAATCRQVAKSKLPQVAASCRGASCGKSRQATARCRGDLARQVAASCRKLPCGPFGRAPHGKLPQVAVTCRGHVASRGKLPQVAVRGPRQLAATCREPREWKVGHKWRSLFLFPFLKESLEKHPTATCRNLQHAARGKLRQVAASCRGLIPSKNPTTFDVPAELKLREDLEVSSRQVAASCRQVGFRPRQVAASCRKLPCRASCRKLPQVAARALGGKLPQVAVKSPSSWLRQVAASCRNLPSTSAGPRLLST